MIVGLVGEWVGGWLKNLGMSPDVSLSISKEWKQLLPSSQFQIQRIYMKHISKEHTSWNWEYLIWDKMQDIIVDACSSILYTNSVHGNYHVLVNNFVIGLLATSIVSQLIWTDTFHQKGGDN